jgi:hypothetical protein
MKLCKKIHIHSPTSRRPDVYRLELQSHTANPRELRRHDGIFRVQLHLTLSRETRSLQVAPPMPGRPARTGHVLASWHPLRGSGPCRHCRVGAEQPLDKALRPRTVSGTGHFGRCHATLPASTSQLAANCPAGPSSIPIHSHVSHLGCMSVASSMYEVGKRPIQIEDRSTPFSLFSNFPSRFARIFDHDTHFAGTSFLTNSPYFHSTPSSRRALLFVFFRLRVLTFLGLFLRVIASSPSSGLSAVTGTLPCPAPPSAPNYHYSQHCLSWPPRMHSEGGP